jgi:hypothetical protein
MQRKIQRVASRFAAVSNANQDRRNVSLFNRNKKGGGRLIKVDHAIVYIKFQNGTPETPACLFPNDNHCGCVTHARGYDQGTR